MIGSIYTQFTIPLDYYDKSFLKMNFVQIVIASRIAYLATVEEIPCGDLALVVEESLSAHQDAMRHVFEELTEDTVFEYRGYTENGCNENTGLDTVTTLTKRIVFNYCVKCGEHLDENQHGCNFKLCTKCYTGFAVNQSYKIDYDDEDYDYDDEEDRAERLREDRLDSYLDRHEDWD